MDFKFKHLKVKFESPVSDEVCVSRKMITSSQLDPPVSDEICVSQKMIGKILIHAQDP